VQSGSGARAWRLVTATPGQLGHQPAGTMTGARGASLEVRDDVGGELRRVASSARSLARVAPLGWI